MTTDVTAVTRCGALTGYRASEGVLHFKGIPYASPPTGDRRWLPPHPVSPWSGPRNATDFGPICPQIVADMGAVGGSNLEPQDEDCLYLNIATPGLDDARRPTMVWFHGGGFLIG